ncbi:MAG: hypothetical protein FWG85_05930 [Bacteroidetes bacterium]|nr:hypothetical protein [Bacteroidota bacterium]
MLKTICSVGLAILGGFILLKIIGFLFTVMWFAMKLGIVIVFAIPLFFVIRYVLSKLFK